MKAKIEAAADALHRYLLPGGDESPERLYFAQEMINKAVEEYRTDSQIRAEQMAILTSYGGTHD